MPASGDVIGPFVLARPLGRGGMGETWLAVRRDGTFEQRVCVKLVHPDYRGSAEVVAMFQREAELAASVRHGSLVQVIDVGPGAEYIAYELVDGPDLRTVLLEAPEKRLPPQLVSYVVLEVCRALVFLHNRTVRGEPSPVVHRDISPANILVSHAGEVKLADLGIAKVTRDAEHSQALKGKLSYLSPEQARQQPVDGRSDQFSLGVTAYQLLTGIRPFDGETEAETFRNVLQARAKPLRLIARQSPVGLVHIVEKMLAPDASDRYATALDVIRDVIEHAPPPPDAFLQLGDLARRVRPHETVHSNASLAVPNEATPSRKADAAHASGQPTQTARAEWPDIAARVAADAPTRTAPIATGSGDATTREADAGPRRAVFRRLPRRRVVLGGLALALLITGALTGSRLFMSSKTSSTDEHVDAGAPSATREPASQKPTATANSKNEPPSTEVARGVHGESPPNASVSSPEPSDTRGPSSDDATDPAPRAPPAPSAADDPPRPRSPRREARAARSSPSGRSARRKGTLKVGAFPVSKVWIDGRFRGRSPIEIELPAGRHVVEAGRDEPTQRKHVRLRPGKVETVVLRLEADE